MIKNSEELWADVKCEQNDSDYRSIRDAIRIADRQLSKIRSITTMTIEHARLIESYIKDLKVGFDTGDPQKIKKAVQSIYNMSTVKYD